MHLCMKIPRHTSKNPIAAGNFQWIFARNCEGTEQLQIITHIQLPVLLIAGSGLHKKKKYKYNKIIRRFDL